MYSNFKVSNNFGFRMYDHTSLTDLNENTLTHLAFLDLLETFLPNSYTDSPAHPTCIYPDIPLGNRERRANPSRSEQIRVDLSSIPDQSAPH